MDAGSPPLGVAMMHGRQTRYRLGNDVQVDGMYLCANTHAFTLRNSVIAVD
jgi:hypothetical protein